MIGSIYGLNITSIKELRTEYMNVGVVEKLKKRQYDGDSRSGNDGGFFCVPVLVDTDGGIWSISSPDDELPDFDRITSYSYFAADIRIDVERIGEYHLFRSVEHISDSEDSK